MIRPALSLSLRDLLHIRGYKLCFAERVEKTLYVTLSTKRKTGLCPVCGKRCKNIETTFGRWIRDRDVYDYKCYILFPERKIKCRCGYRGIEKLEFVDPYSRCTIRMEEYVFRLCKYMTLQDVCELLGLEWRTVKNIDWKYLSRLNIGLDEVHPSRIGVDEVSYQKGHNYLTIVRDIDLGKVIWIGFSRKKETLDSFFKELGPIKSHAITVAVMDMWDPYIASVKEHTGAEIVFDKFHVSKKINEAVDTVRKQEFAKADPQERKEMKHKRFLILARNKNLPEEKRHELEQLMQQNTTLYEVYLLKEQVLDIFDERDVETALMRLVEWLDNIAKSGITAFDAVIQTMMNYLYGILNYFKHHLTNAASEGFNNKIQVIKRRAYGFHDLEYFKLKILQNLGVTKS
jgi:transposase